MSHHAPLMTHLLKRHARPLALLAALSAPISACDSEEPPAEAGVMAGVMAGVTGGEAGVIGGEAGVIGGEAGVIGGEAGVIGGEAGITGGEAGVMGGEAGAMMTPSCLGGNTFGLRAAPMALELPTEGVKSAPMIAAHPEGGHLITWLGVGEDGENYLHMQRLDEAGVAQGEPHLFGRAKGGQYALHMTSSGAIVLWINQRSDALSNEAVYLQAFDLAGAPRTEAPIALEGSFGATYMSSAWLDAVGGMVAYASPAGLFMTPFSLSGLGTSAEQVTSSAARTPSLSFGGVGWAVAWSERDAAGSVDVHFQTLTEAGAPYGERKSFLDSKAQGAPQLIYGNGSYALAWSQPDPTIISGQGRLIVALRLLDETGNELGVIPVAEGEDSMQLSSVSWLTPSVFMLTWHGFGGSQSSVGFSRVNNLGQVLNPVIVEAADGALFAEASVIGSASAAQVAMTIDPTPLPTGLFSAETRVSITPLGPCE